MASPQLENGYTTIANELLEKLIYLEFPKNTGSLPLRLCIFIIRKTYGYHKKMDIISLSQFQKATNEKSRTNLSFWLKYLVLAKILVRIKKSDNEIEYGLNKDYEQWLTPVQARALVQARNVSSTMASTKTSTMAMTYKRKKENKRNYVASNKEFSLKEYLIEMSNDNRRHINVIGHYFEEKGLKFDNFEEIESAIRRHCKPAIEVAKFTDEKIVKATDQAKKEYGEKFTIETIYKLLTR